MPLLDFDTLVISDTAYVDGSCVEPCSVSSIMSCFHGIGIKNFYVLQAADLSVSSPSILHSSHKQFKHRLKSCKPRGACIHTACDLHLSPLALTNRELDKLYLTHTNKLFIQAPLFSDGSWLNSDLKFLVYKQNVHPIFASFERLLISCEPTFCAALMRIRSAAFCIDVNYMVNPTFESVLRKALSDNIALIPCVSNQLYAYSGIVDKFADLRDRLGKETYLQLCKHVNVSCKRTFT